jgi:hypothetical protein
LSLGIKLPVSWQLTSVILLVMPCQSCFDLLKVYILTAQQHFSQNTLIAVPFVPLRFNCFAKDQIGQILPGYGAEWLLSLRRINTYKPYLVLAV